MNAIQKLAKNVGSLFISQVLSYAIGFIYTVYLVRYLGVEDFGILSFAISLTSIMAIFCDLGLNTLLTREVARDKSLTKKYLNNVISIKLLLSLVLVIVSVSILNIIGYSQTELYVIYLLLLLVIFNSFSGVFYSVFQAYERMEYQSVANLLNSILMLIGIAILIYFNFGLIVLAFIYAFVGGLVLIYYFYISSTKFKFSKPKLTVNLKFWKQTITTALQFGLIGVFSTIYVWIDSVMLSFMVGNLAVGLYNAAYRIVLLLRFIPIVINMAIFPVMSKLYGSSDSSLKLVVEKYLKFMILISIPMGVGITILAEDIIILIFGDAYQASAVALQILIWATVITFISSSYAQFFQSSNRQMTVTKIAFVGMIVNITLNLIFIPKYGYIAASFNTLLTELTTAILLFISANKNAFLNKRKVLIDFIKISISSLIMAIALMVLKEINLFISIIISSIIYLIALYLTRTIDEEDLRIVRQIKG